MKFLRDYQPVFFGVIIGLVVLNLWYLSGVAVENAVLPKSYDYIIRAFTVAVGAFIGAFSAFWLKKHEEYKSEVKAQKVALNSALFVLIRQLNAIARIKQDFDKYKTPFDRALSLPAFKPPNYSDVRQDINSLHFLIDKGEATLLMELTIEQERFEQAINSISIRNEFYVNEVQPALSHHALNGKPLPLSEFENKLGERLFKGSINGAANMYDLVYSSAETIIECYTKLRDFSKQMFPGEKFVAMQKM